LNKKGRKKKVRSFFQQSQDFFSAVLPGLVNIEGPLPQTCVEGNGPLPRRMTGLD
jgi:hypothetical protein